MSKIAIIIQREYLTRIRKKSFIVMTFLGPVLFAAMMVLPVWFTTLEDEDVKNIAVYDSSYLFFKKIPETEKFKFKYDKAYNEEIAKINIDSLKKNLSKSNYFGILYIPDYITYIPQGVEFYSHKQPPANLVMHIANAIEKEIERKKLLAHDIDDLENILHSIKTRIDIRTFKLSDSGEEVESHSILNMGVAYVSALLIFMFIFIFGSLVMRSVIEEKAGRIVELIVSSVKPFQLLMGKVVGVALVGLTQFLAWIVLSLMIVIPAKSLFFSNISEEVVQQTNRLGTVGSMAGDYVQYSDNTEMALELYSMMQSINFGTLIFCFIVFFIGGYLLYASLFAAIGSAVDNEADTQQFILPVTIPLFIAIALMVNVMQNPDGQLAFWFSMVPLSSPVIMMARIPFGVPYIEVAISIALLILAFIGTIWLSAKIYHTGILTYGKKLTYRELWKWLRYKN